MGRTGPAAVAILLFAGCAPGASPTPNMASLAPDPPAAPGDPRLGPVLAQIAANPGWAEGSVAGLSVVNALPSIDYLCVEVARAGEPALHVVVDVDEPPWRVGSISVFDPDEGPRTTFERNEFSGNGDACSFVLLGSDAPFPADPAAIEVNGGLLDPAHLAPIRAAVHAAPERFGIEPTGAPAIDLEPVQGPLDRPCYQGVVFVGGPRALVAIGLREDAGAWRVTSLRIERQALRPEEPRQPDGC